MPRQRKANMNYFEPHLKIICLHPLFDGIGSTEDLLSLLSAVGARVAHYSKHRVILAEDAVTSDIGIVLFGRAQASRLEPSGQRFIQAELRAGSVFGNVLAVGGHQKSPVTLKATETVTILLIPFDQILSHLDLDSKKRSQLLRNILKIVSAKYFELQERLVCITKPTLREKILYYLSSVSKQENSRVFEIPFNREAFADYLHAERSALSRELSAMKKDGILDYYKNSFTLKSWHPMVS